MIKGSKGLEEMTARSHKGIYIFCAVKKLVLEAAKDKVSQGQLFLLLGLFDKFINAIVKK